MLDKILKLHVLVLSAYLALGSFDVFFGQDSVIGTMHLLLLGFVVFCSALHPKDVFAALLKAGPLSLFALVAVFTLSQAIYGASIYDVGLINFKLIVCIYFYVALTAFFKINPEYVYYSLASFVFSAIVYAIVVLYLLPDIYEIYKGQLLVLGENPNSTSSRLAIAFICLLAFFVQSKARISGWKVVIFILALPILELIVKSGSRGALLAVAGSLLLFIGLSKIQIKYRLILVLFVIVATPLFINYLLSSDGLADRWIMAAEGDTSGRTDIWKYAFFIFMNNPILGIGEGGYFQEISGMYGQFIDTHNLFVYLIVCGGVVALSLFLFFLAPLLKSATYAFGKNDALPIILLINIIFLASKTGGVITYVLMWYVFSIIYSYRGAVGQNI